MNTNVEQPKRASEIIKAVHAVW